MSMTSAFQVKVRELLMLGLRVGMVVPVPALVLGAFLTLLVRIAFVVAAVAVAVVVVVAVVSPVKGI